MTEIVGPAGRAPAIALLCAAGTFVMTGPAARAQEGADAPGPAKGATIEEVVVTAERREETAQKTPLAVTALTTDSLRTLGVSSAGDLNSVAPGLEIGGNGAGSLDISIRGIGSSNDTEVGDPAVAFNVDGVYMSRSRSANGIFYDIDRIEVLRGPQGTLYGRNATAGAINVITNRPVDRFEAAAALQVGDYGQVLTSGMVNLPVGDTFAARGAFQTAHRDSYSHNGYNNEDSQSARLQAQFKPADSLSVLLALDRFQAGGNGDIAAPLGQYILPGDEPYHFAVSAPGDNHQVNQGATLTLDWRLPFARLTYIGSYRLDEVKLIQGLTDDSARECVAAIGGGGCYMTHFHSTERTTSDELRLAGDSSDWKWVAGLYYFHEHNDVLAALNPLPGVASLAFIQPDTTEESKAVFAQATYSVTDLFRLTGGIRHTEDEKARLGGTYVLGVVSGFNYSCPIGALTAPFPMGCQLYPNIANYNWNKTNWKAGAEFDIAPTSLAYVSAGTGYKAGGYGDGPAPDNNKYGPENLTAYELGVKNTFLGHRVQLNLAGFYYDYQDFQVTGAGVVAGQVSAVTQNAQKAKLYGIELEGAVALTEYDRIDGNASYLHSRYTRFTFATPDGFGLTDYSGLPLAHSPQWTLNGGYQHRFDLGGHGTLTPRVQARYVSDQNLEYHNFPVTRQRAYTRTDMTVTYTSANQNWDVMAYGRNLENKAVLVNATPDAQANNPLAGTGVYAPPRTYGAGFDIRFR